MYEKHYTQICGRGDTVEALTHVLAQQRRAAANPRGDSAVASVSAGTGYASQAAAKGIPSPPPQSLSQDDFAKVRAAVLERDGGKNGPSSPPVSGTGSGTGPGPTGGSTSSQKSSGVVPPAVPTSPSTGQQQKQSRWASAGGGGSPAATRSPDCESDGRIDARLFAPVLRAILAGEGDHVLRRSLLCHPFLKAGGGKASGSAASGGGTGGSSWGTSSKGSGSSAVASSPLSGGRRKEGKGGKGGKAKKRDRDRASKSQDEFVPPQGSPSSSKAAGGGGGEAERSSPLDVSAEMGRLTERAASDRSLQSTLILVKTLLCAVDPGTKSSVLGIDSPRRQAQQGGRAGRTQAPGVATAAASRGEGSDDRTSSTGRSPPAELAIRAAPLKALAGPGLSGWADMMELLRREKYRERMVALRGRPSLTVCSGKAEIRGRLDVKGESSGVVTAVQVGPQSFGWSRKLGLGSRVLWVWLCAQGYFFYLCISLRRGCDRKVRLLPTRVPEMVSSAMSEEKVCPPISLVWLLPGVPASCVYLRCLRVVATRSNN